MAKKTKPPTNSLRLRLRAELDAATIKPDDGFLPGCTVGKANVEALGKSVMLNAAGAVTLDEEEAVARLPVWTDERFLDTLLTAAAAAGPKVKAREDHNDTIGARAGYFDGFRRVGDRIVADGHLFASYRNRDVVLETARATPDEIGLSIDFLPEYELREDRALLRVRKLLAVDIVDQGAITPGGLFLSAADVDSDGNDQAATPTPSKMPDKPAVTNEEIFAALGNLAKTITDCMTALSARAAPPAAPAEGEMAAIRQANEKLAADVAAIKADAATKEAAAKRERALLGLDVRTPEGIARFAATPTEELERLAAANGSTKKKYFDLVDEAVATRKLKRSEAHRVVMKENPEAYREHLRLSGVYDPAKVKTFGGATSN